MVISKTRFLLGRQCANRWCCSRTISAYYHFVRIRPFLLLVTVLVLWGLYLTGRGIRKIEATILLSIYLAYAILRLADPAVPF